MKRDGNASDHLRKQAAATPQDELAAGLPRQPESIQTQALLAQVLERDNLQRALKQVRRNKGAPGIDGMTVDELPEYLKHHWLELRAQLETPFQAAKSSPNGAISIAPFVISSSDLSDRRAASVDSSRMQSASGGFRVFLPRSCYCATP